MGDKQNWVKFIESFYRIQNRLPRLGLNITKRECECKMQQDAVGDGQFCPHCRYLANWRRVVFVVFIMWKHDVTHKTGIS